MCFVRALLAVKVHSWITGIIWRRLVLLLFRPETFQTGRRFQQRAINCEVLIAEQFVSARMVQHARKKLFRDVPAQQPIAILREGSRVPYAIIHVQPDEPTKQHVVVQLFHQQSLAAHAVEHLQQQRPQQLFRRDRWPTHSRVKLVELRRQLHKHCIRNLAYRAARVTAITEAAAITIALRDFGLPKARV
jgi:hypothetical protein